MLIFASTAIIKVQLLNTLISNADRFEDELSRHAIGDFIARAFQSDVAVARLDQLSHGGSKARHVAFVGFDVLRMRLAKSEPLYEKVMEKWCLLQTTSGV